MTKTMLSIVVIFAFTALANAALFEYDEDLLAEMDLTRPDAEEFTVSVINADLTRDLERHIEENLNMATMVSILLPAYELRGNHPICKSSLGININDGQAIFCNMVMLQLHASEVESDMQFMKLSLYFAMRSNRPFVMIIPIFKRPNKYEEAGQEEQFKEWAAEERVGIKSPMTAQQLNDIRNDLSVPVNFTWLNDLVSMGVSEGPFVVMRSGRQIRRVIEESCVTRPLVLSRDITEKLLELAFWRNYLDADMADVLPSTSIPPR